MRFERPLHSASAVSPRSSGDLPATAPQHVDVSVFEFKYSNRDRRSAADIDAYTYGSEYPIFQLRRARERLLYTYGNDRQHTVNVNVARTNYTEKGGILQ